MRLAANSRTAPRSLSTLCRNAARRRRERPRARRLHLHPRGRTGSMASSNASRSTRRRSTARRWSRPARAVDAVGRRPPPRRRCRRAGPRSGRSCRRRRPGRAARAARCSTGSSPATTAAASRGSVPGMEPTPVAAPSGQRAAGGCGSSSGRGRARAPSARTAPAARRPAPRRRARRRAGRRRSSEAHGCTRRAAAGGRHARCLPPARQSVRPGGPGRPGRARTHRVGPAHIAGGGAEPLTVCARPAAADRTPSAGGRDRGAAHHSVACVERDRLARGDTAERLGQLGAHAVAVGHDAGGGEAAVRTHLHRRRRTGPGACRRSTPVAPRRSTDVQRLARADARPCRSTGSMPST